jgi:CheY-like chemotaxis protein
MRSMNADPPQAPPRFLVVDDQRDSADSLSMLLESWGCRAAAAYDGRAGIELANLLRPDAVLLDLRMPGTTGFDTCKAIRSSRWSAETIIVAVTGSLEDQAVALTDAGFDGVFPKPAQPETLKELVELVRCRPSSTQALTPSLSGRRRANESGRKRSASPRG